MPLLVRGGDGLENFSILFVDDETEFLHTLLKRMKKRVSAAFGAANGDEALSFLEHNPVDVVVLGREDAGHGRDRGAQGDQKTVPTD